MKKISFVRSIFWNKYCTYYVQDVPFVAFTFKKFTKILQILVSEYGLPHKTCKSVGYFVAIKKNSSFFFFSTKFLAICQGLMVQTAFWFHNLLNFLCIFEMCLLDFFNYFILLTRKIPLFDKFYGVRCWCTPIREFVILFIFFFMNFLNINVIYGSLWTFFSIAKGKKKKKPTNWQVLLWFRYENLFCFFKWTFKMWTELWDTHYVMKETLVKFLNTNKIKKLFLKNTRIISARDGTPYDNEQS